MLRAYRTKLRPTQSQRDTFLGCAGCARYVYNWAIRDRQQGWEERQERVNKFEQKRRFNATKDEFASWVRQYPYVISEAAFDQADLAFQNFWRKWRNGDVARMIAQMQQRGKWGAYVARQLAKGNHGMALNPGWPAFRRRVDRQRFTLRGAISVEVDRVKLPVIGWVRLAERDYLPTQDVKILSANISLHADAWHIALQVEEPDAPVTPPSGEPVGVDTGYGLLAVTSDGAQYANPATLLQYEKKLARLQRELSRRTMGGANWKKTKEKITALHAKIANIRNHNLHNVSRAIVNKRPSKLVLESWNIQELLQEDSAATRAARRHIRQADAANGELRRQLTYKQTWAGGEVVDTPGDTATNRTCAVCGHVKAELPPSVELYHCENCGIEINRRLNTARYMVQLVNP